MTHSMPLDAADVDRFMRAKGATRSCAVCGQDAGYETYDEVSLAKRFTIFRFQFPDYDTQNVEAADIVLVECRNCKVLRIHNRAPIVEWAAEHPQKPANYS